MSSLKHLLTGIGSRAILRANAPNTLLPHRNNELVSGKRPTLREGARVLRSTMRDFGEGEGVDLRKMGSVI